MALTKVEFVYLEYNRENKNETNTNSRKHIQRNRNKDAN